MLLSRLARPAPLSTVPRICTVAHPVHPAQPVLRIRPTLRRTMASSAPVAVPTFKLNDGHEIPCVAFGLGTALYKDGSAGFDQRIVDSAVAAIRAGFRHIDGAEMYGNEEEMGAAIRAAGVPRDELFVVTKYKPQADGTVEASFAESLRKLGLDHVDLYLMHSPYWPGVTDAQLQSRWAEFEAIQRSGRATSIGVSNFLQSHLEAVLATARVPPVINQVEFHPYLQHGDLVPFARSHGILTSAYSPLTPVFRVTDGPVTPLLTTLAEKYGVTPSDIGLRWVIDQGIVAITTTSNPQRLQTYLARLTSFKLTPAEVDEISAAGKTKHHRVFWTHVFAADDTR